MKYLTQKLAQSIDMDLMSAKFGYTIDQLMELAGLSVAESIAKEYKDKKRIVLCIGPGNNGGDGLVAARHLVHFGYAPVLYYPKQPKRDLYQGLTQQCKKHGIKETDDLTTAIEQSDVVVDAFFGFSFSGPIRPPFDDAIGILRQCKKPIVSVDIPSGWDVERGDVDGVGVHPEMLISLTAPKLCAKLFKGQSHYLGGRFIPPELSRELGIPEFPGTDQCVKLDI